MGNAARKQRLNDEGKFSEKALKQLFSEFDANGDGFVSKDEFGAALERVGIVPTSVELDAMIAVADRNNDDQISLVEFRGLVAQCSALACLLKAFSQFDADGDGIIKLKDVQRVMKECGQNLTPQQVKAMFSVADVDANGEISFEEFGILMRKRPLTLNVEDIFKTYDINSDGYITLMELRTVCDKLEIPATDEELKVMFRMADVSGDGKITYEEFQQLLIRGQEAA